MWYRQTASMMATLVLAAAALAGASPAAGAPGSALDGAVATARAASGCAPLQWDPLVQRSAQMANKSTTDYVDHASAAVPFTDPLPALATIGYPASKGKLLVGYGQSPGEALKGLILQYQGLKPDCDYSHFGTDSAQNAAGKFFATAVLATPA